MTSAQGTVGRDMELASIRAFLDSAGGRLTALLIEGEVGIGKSSLWRETVRAAEERGHRVLACQPTENEAGIGFAGLIDLLGSWVDESAAELPEPQRRALDAALMRTSSDAAVRQGAVAVAVLGVLRTLARSAPTTVAIDDPQWLDMPTRQALGFALRRLDAEPVAVVVTRRRDRLADELIEGLPVTRLAVPPMSLGATYQLVHARLGVTLARPALVRVYETSGGNPFFSLELARAWIDRGGVADVGHLPVPERLGDLLRRRLEDLPDGTRRVLLIAAAMAAPSVQELQEACDRPVERDLARAETAGVVDSSDGIVRFSHPLMAATVYGAATAAERRMLHRELAGAVRDPEERARHLALTSPEPDEALAEALEDAATRVARRGATDVAATYAQRALDFTPPGDRGASFRRATAAGVHAMAAGDRARARALFERAVADAPAGPGRAEALRWLAELSTPLGQGIALCDRALQDAGTDQAVASRIHRTRGAISYFLGDVPAAEHHAGLGVELAEGSGDDQALGMALAELAHWTYCGGGGVRRDLFERAIALDGSAGASSPRSHLAKVVMDNDEHDEARSLLTLLLDETMETGDLYSASTHRFHLAELDVWAGDWIAAIEHAEESLQLRQHLDRPGAPLYVEAMARACLGDVDEARNLAEAGLVEALRAEDVVFRMQNLHVLGFVELSLGNHEAARAFLGEATDLMRPRWNREFGDCHMVPDEIEALVALGDLARAEDLAGWMDEVARATHRPWTVATGARSRALVQAARNDLDEADATLERALAAHERLPMALELGRTLLTRGIVQRRMRRRAVARETLEQALALFEGRGATLWAERARSEIARIGVRSAAQVDLTPVERRMAALVAQGCTNQEIAASLSVSRKTVEANLSRSYRKLGVRSRAELVARLSVQREPTSTSSAPNG
ncbi:AAA family ATPase [Nocardioides islandensis]|uniref:AAA family ATPase n=1 Tax=Nocardioides islandensis TaxID=433663 RepID=A0A930VG29_9ACTN|nr:AAA family ATPase [Nocardioides islandensis]MBF4765933.1 AAA family ATPase [Nocardioides islandensis]